MKKFIVFALLMVGSYVWAAGVQKKDGNGNILRGIAPTAFGVSQSTKADITISTASMTAIRVQPNAAVTVKVNGSGTAWPIAQNAIQEYHIPAAVTSLVFSVTSSATATKVYYQSE